MGTPVHKEGLYPGDPLKEEQTTETFGPERNSQKTTGRKLAEEHLRYFKEILIYCLERADRGFQRDRDDLDPLESYHLTPVFFRDQVYGGYAEPCGENSVKSRRRSAPLDMAQDRGPCFKPGPFLDLLRERFADASKFHVAEIIKLLAPRDERAGVLRQGAFRGDHDAEILSSRVPFLEEAADLFDVERLFRYQYDVGSAGDAAVSRDPPGVSSHYLHNHYPVVRLRGRV